MGARMVAWTTTLEERRAEASGRTKTPATDDRQGHHGPHAMCEEAEALVEFYLQEISESLASLHLTRQQIDNTERYDR